MNGNEQPLFDDPNIEKANEPVARSGKLRIARAEREQAEVYFETLDERIGEDHPVRSIWTFVDSLDLEEFYKDAKVVEGKAGRSMKDRKILFALWVFAITEGIHSGRQIERLTERDDAYRWLCGGVSFNYHIINDFRSTSEAALDQALAQCIAVMMKEDLIDPLRIEIDGTKIRAKAKATQFRREPTIKEYLKAAEEHLLAVKTENEQNQDLSKKQKAARLRFAQERTKKCAQALDELAAVRSHSRQDAANVRVSLSEPESRKMRFGNGGGLMPAYNVQIPKSLDKGAILGVTVSQDQTDASGLENTIPQVTKNTGQKPEAVVTDADFVNYRQLDYADREGFGFYSPPKKVDAKRKPSTKKKPEFDFIRDNSHVDLQTKQLICPAKKRFSLHVTEYSPGALKLQFGWRKSTCATCPLFAKCCPSIGKRVRFYRNTERSDMLNEAFYERTQADEGTVLLKLRFAKELTNAKIKAMLNFRQFHVQGRHRARSEILLVAVTFNMLLLQALRKKQFLISKTDRATNE